MLGGGEVVISNDHKVSQEQEVQARSICGSFTRGLGRVEGFRVS